MANCGAGETSRVTNRVSSKTVRGRPTKKRTSQGVSKNTRTRY